MKDAGFKRFQDRIRKRQFSRYVYARRNVPPSAVAVILERGSRWWWVTPAMAQDSGAWRVSFGDERGPAGHETSDWMGRSFWTKYDAIMDVLTANPSARITAVVMPGGGRIQVSKVRPNPGRPEYKQRRRR